MADGGTTPSAFNCRISSDLDVLEALNAVHPWIPGRSNIRPPVDRLQAKHDYLEMVRRSYASEGAYVLHIVFGMAPSTDDQGRYCFPQKDLSLQRKTFQRNEFPYDLPDGTRHFVMWYTYGPCPELSDAKISQDICEGLQQRLGHTCVEFVWYLNPKMTIPDVFHVQVFWHVTTVGNT